MTPSKDVLKEIVDSILIYFPHQLNIFGFMVNPKSIIHNKIDQLSVYQADMIVDKVASILKKDGIR